MMELLASQIAAAVNMRTLYPPNHPQCVRSVEDMVAGIRRELQRTNMDAVTYVLIGDDLVADDDLIRKRSLSVREFAQILKRRGVERLTFASGIDSEEADRFVNALAGGTAPQASPHIVVGRAQLLMEDESKEKAEKRDFSKQIEIVREA